MCIYIYIYVHTLFNVLLPVALACAVLTVGEMPKHAGMLLQALRSYGCLHARWAHISGWHLISRFSDNFINKHQIDSHFKDEESQNSTSL